MERRDADRPRARPRCRERDRRGDAVYTSLSQLTTEANDLSADAKGFVVRFDDGLRLNEFPADIHGMIFTLRKQKDGLLSGRPRQVIFRLVRPTGNELPGYVPSYAIARLQDEST